MEFLLIETVHSDEQPSSGPNGHARKRICIVGGGANGLGTLKVLADTPQVKSSLWTIVAFEERDSIGGIWCVQFPSF